MDHIFKSAPWIAGRKHQIRTVPNQELHNYHWLFGHWCTHNLMDPYHLDYTEFIKSTALTDKPVVYAVHPLMNPSDDEYLLTVQDLKTHSIELAYYTPWLGLSHTDNYSTLDQFHWEQLEPKQVTVDSWHYYVWEHCVSQHIGWKPYRHWVMAKIVLASLNNPQ